MTREFIKKQMNEIIDNNQSDFISFYLRYTDQNVTSNLRGKIAEFEQALQKAEKSRDCIQGILPISLLVLINESCVHCWTKNPLWNPVDYEDEDSHVYTNVPLIGRNGWFVDNKDWLDLDAR